jgi:hypothetical protein
MKTLSKIYSDKETRNGIAVNKTYLVPVYLPTRTDESIDPIIMVFTES